MASPESLTSVNDCSAFAEAKELFLSSVSPQERLQFSACSSGEEILTQINSFTTDPRRRNKIVARIKVFSDLLGPYFDVLELVVSSHPEYAAVAWGALRLVLQVGLVTLNVGVN